METRTAGHLPLGCAGDSPVVGVAGAVSPYTCRYFPLAGSVRQSGSAAHRLQPTTLY